MWELFRESISIANILRLIKYKNKFKRDNPDYFNPSGLLLFVGAQGTGKTLSAVNYIYNVMKKYPKCMLVTNVYLKDYPIDNERVFCFYNNDDFMKYSNGNYGVVFFVDEIQLYLNSLESKNINLDVIGQISQQRKQRKHIVATSQVFGRMAKPLREQFNHIVLCKNVLGFIQYNRLVDRDSLDGETSTDTNIKGETKKKFFYFHSPIYYDRYDTYSVIEKNKFVSREEQKSEIYENDNILKVVE